MSWLSFDDGYTRQRVWDGMPYEARWHYHAVVERCCDTRRYDGVLPWPLALRCSDVPEPMDAVKVLIAAGLLADRGSDIVVLDIDHFLPPESERPENKLPRKRANTAESRRRKCERGDHDRHCPSKTCPVKLEAREQRESAWVTGYPGSGRVGTGREVPRNEVPGKDALPAEADQDLDPAPGFVAPGHEVDGNLLRRNLGKPPRSRRPETTWYLTFNTSQAMVLQTPAWQTVTRANGARRTRPPSQNRHSREPRTQQPAATAHRPRHPRPLPGHPPAARRRRRHRQSPRRPQSHLHAGRAMTAAICGTCTREVPVRSDGRLRAHLATHGRRGTCAGSGAFAVAEPASEPPHPTRQLVSDAARFNARAEWRKADVLYGEYIQMTETGAADDAAIDSAYDAYSRAWDDAKALDAMRLA